MNKRFPLANACLAKQNKRLTNMSKAGTQVVLVLKKKSYKFFVLMFSITVCFHLLKSNFIKWFWS